MATRVLLADDHGIVLDGLKALLSTDSDILVVGTCVNGVEVVEAVGKEAPDLLIMDLQMPLMNGLEVLQTLKASGRLPPTVLIAASLGRGEEREARALGAWGVVLKDQASSLILECVHAVMDGEEWLPASIAGGSVAPARAAVGIDVLTRREVEIAEQVSRGFSNKRIAGSLGLAEGTVKSHLNRIYRKLDVGNRVQLALLFRAQRPS